MPAEPKTRDSHLTRSTLETFLHSQFESCMARDSTPLPVACHPAEGLDRVQLGTRRDRLVGAGIGLGLPAVLCDALRHEVRIDDHELVGEGRGAAGGTLGFKEKTAKLLDSGHVPLGTSEVECRQPFTTLASPRTTRQFSTRAAASTWSCTRCASTTSRRSKGRGLGDQRASRRRRGRRSRA